VTHFLNTADSEWYKARLARALLCIVAAFVVLIVRLFYLQVLEGEELRRLSENNCIRLQSIDPNRGLILDHHGRRLVDNRPSFDLGIVPKDAAPMAETLGKLAAHLNIPHADLLQRVKEAHRSPYKTVLLKQDIGRDALAALEVNRYDLPGVVIDIKPRRHYISSRSAAHLLGYLGEISPAELKSGRFPGSRGGDFVGKVGVEKVFETHLRGERGGRQVEVDATGQVFRVLKTVEARPGNNLILTLDYRLQEKAEALLGGRAGAAVAMDPSNGEILALASSPSFDQNAFASGLTQKQWNELVNNPFRPMTNKAIQGEYPPASTYKIITAIAGLEEGVIDENSSFFCPGHYRFGDRVFRCWKKYGHGDLSVVDAIAQSCDVFFYQVGQKLGVDRLAWYAKAFGLGSRTGIDLDHEAAGLVPTAAWKKRRTGVNWLRGETLSVAIGQGYNLTTPLQLLVMTATIANGGVRYKPQILKKIETAEGRTVMTTHPEVAGRVPVSRRTMETVSLGLWEVVNGPRGTARSIRTDAYSIAGKTGTAQVFSRKSNDSEEEEDRAYHLKSHAWFVAYAPSLAPKIAVCVIVEHGEHGSSAAAPIAAALIAEYLNPAAQDSNDADTTIAAADQGGHLQ
jgi:penicillin-binding protein 2